MNVKIKIEMHGQIIWIEFGFSFPTIYHNDMYANGKVPPKIMLLYGGISPYPCIQQFRPGSECSPSFCPCGNIMSIDNEACYHIVVNFEGQPSTLKIRNFMKLLVNGLRFSSYPNSPPDASNSCNSNL